MMTLTTLIIEFLGSFSAHSVAKCSMLAAPNRGQIGGDLAGINLLTTMQIKNAKTGQKLDDGGGLRFASGAKGGRWLFRYTFNGTRREMGLGSANDLSLSNARKLRAKWALVLNSGLDPISERQRELDEASATGQDDPTFQEIYDLFLGGYRERLKNETAVVRWTSCMRTHVLPKIGGVRVSELHQRHIHDALAPIWHKKHETADKALYRTRMVVKHARLTGFAVDPFICDAARHMLGYVHHEKAPTPATDWRDVPDLFKRLDEQRPPHLALKFVILTVARLSPVLGARFSEIEGDVWTVPAERMKGTRGRLSEFRIPLSSAALEVVEKCREIADGGDFLFPSPKASKDHIVDLTVTKVLNEMGETGRTHGLRTSFRTWVQDTEAAGYEVAETALAHVIGNKVERAYARSDLLERRRTLMQQWADYVTQKEEAVAKLP